ncbi:MICAL-like protein 1 [Thalassophryne amazonica]|uniref:MICAL-like protein 1 n=1 Tax=Thalassophryne amazonica TaxID=390379 RepID=UPI0014717528|nr:MICAL-like protein 1 [Thalassophryne amazonica]XP_034045525.1 MICAL-like protein 1 [Thalassophryne amazonica]
MSVPYRAPVPAPRCQSFHTKSSFCTTGKPFIKSKSSSFCCSTNPTGSSCKVVSNHPWLSIIHPGPWTQLPPAAAPIPPLWPKIVCNKEGPWYTPRLSPLPNPFVEDEEECEDITEDTRGHESTTEDEDQSAPSVSQPENGHGPPHKSGYTRASVCSSVATKCAKVQDKQVQTDFREAGGGAGCERGKGASATSGEVHQTGKPDLAKTAGTRGWRARSHDAQTQTSLPAVGSAPPQNPFMSEQEDESQPKCAAWSSDSEPCNGNPFEPQPAVQDEPPRRVSVPGHDVPLIKRKVQTDINISTETLQVEMEELVTRLEALELRGAELEKSLRDCKNDEEEEKILMDWFSVIQERHILVRRETELVFLTKQQKLETRQADVEYELRCLFNKPESHWNQKDRGRERQLTDDLFAIIDQRNQIISSLEQDRQREREEDLFWEELKNNKDLQKEGLKELQKSKGNFVPKKVLKMVNHKAEEEPTSSEKEYQFML